MTYVVTLWHRHTNETHVECVEASSDEEAARDVLSRHSGWEVLTTCHVIEEEG